MATSKAGKNKVKEVCKNFLLMGDEQLAQKLQDEEFHEHYDKNRKNNQVIRENVSTVKTIENIEYQELLRQHKMLEKLEKEDALIAMQMQNEFSTTDELDESRRELTDEELAKQLQEKEILYEEFVSHKPTTSIINLNKNQKQRKSNIYSEESIDFADTMNLLNISDDANCTFSSKTLKSNDVSNYKINEHDDFYLAKYLQDEEEKKIRIQNRIKTHSAQLLQKSDEQIARELQNKEASLARSNNFNYASPNTENHSAHYVPDNKHLASKSIEQSSKHQRTSNQQSIMNSRETLNISRQSSLLDYNHASIKQNLVKPAIERVMDKAVNKLVQKKRIHKQSLV